MQELLVNRHGSEDLVSQQQAREGPTATRKIGSLTPLPPNIRLQFAASRTPSRSLTPLATFVTLRRSDPLEGPRSPPQHEETYLQDTNTALTRQLELAHATLQQAQATIASFTARSHSGSAGSSSTSSRERDAPDRHRRSRGRREAREREEREQDERRAARLAADRCEERRQEERWAERREDRLRERQEDRADRVALAEQLASLKSSTASRAQYRIGAALKDVRPFDGATGADGATYIMELTHLMGTHEIPTDMWPRELSLKLVGKARNWYVSRFAALPAGTFPPWAELYAAMLLAYSQLYQAAGAYRDLHCATRVPGTTGKEALHRIDELVMLLQRTGVTTPGEEEQMSYILQNQLTAEELPRWTALANGDMSVSDAGLNELELRTTNVAGGRHSCPPQTREAFFASRTEHLRNFLRDLGAAAGGRNGGAPQARVAAITSGRADATCAPQAQESSSPRTPTTADSAEETAARILLIKARWARRSTRESAPPEYYPGNRAKNQAVFAARKAAQECFACDVKGELVPNQPHWECKLHGLGALGRTTRVPGSGAGRSLVQ